MSTALLTAARNAWPFKDDPIQIGIESDIPWAISKNGSPYSPALCGYAQIPAEGHPWCTLANEDDLDRLVNAPGGITWGPVAPYEFPPGVQHKGRTLKDCGGWIGFDTAHYNDHWPSTELKKVGLVRQPLPSGEFLTPFPWSPGSRDWTIDGIISEARDLARQIAAAR